MSRIFAKIAFWLACGSPFFLLWLAALPNTGRHPSAIVSAIGCVLALSSPAGVVLGFLLFALTTSPYRERGTTSYATAAMVVGLCASLVTAVLFPVFTHPRQNSGPSCLSNLKQLGLAMQMYEQDYDDTLPRAAAWNDELMPYV